MGEKIMEGFPTREEALADFFAAWEPVGGEELVLSLIHIWPAPRWPKPWKRSRSSRRRNAQAAPRSGRRAAHPPGPALPHRPPRRTRPAPRNLRLRRTSRPSLRTTCRTNKALGRCSAAWSRPTWTRPSNRCRTTRASSCRRWPDAPSDSWKKTPRSRRSRYRPSANAACWTRSPPLCGKPQGGNPASTGRRPGPRRTQPTRPLQPKRPSQQ